MQTIGPAENDAEDRQSSPRDGFAYSHTMTASHQSITPACKVSAPYLKIAQSCIEEIWRRPIRITCDPIHRYSAVAPEVFRKRVL